MLQKKSVRESLWNLLKELQHSTVFNNYFLVGGTALSLQLGHLAVANRGDQAKDFYDIYYLLEKISLKDMFEYYKVKYKQNDISLIKRSLVYFDDVTDSNWLAVKLLQDKLSVDQLKQKIIDELNMYNKIILNGAIS